MNPDLFDLEDFKVSDNWPMVAARMMPPAPAIESLIQLWSILGVIQLSFPQYDIRILSGFRDNDLLEKFRESKIPYSPTSQHNFGQAVDFTPEPKDGKAIDRKEACTTMFEWMYNNSMELSRDHYLGQVILELHGNPPWIHMAINSKGGNKFLTQNKDRKTYSPYYRSVTT